MKNTNLLKDEKCLPTVESYPDAVFLPLEEVYFFI